jgi:hypothetical protein
MKLVPTAAVRSGGRDVDLVHAGLERRVLVHRDPIGVPDSRETAEVVELDGQREPGIELHVLVAAIPVIPVPLDPERAGVPERLAEPARELQHRGIRRAHRVRGHAEVRRGHPELPLDRAVE